MAVLSPQLIKKRMLVVQAIYSLDLIVFQSVHSLRGDARTQQFFLRALVSKEKAYFGHSKIARIFDII